MAIQIQISDELWDYLMKSKQRGETFDEVLRRKLKLNDNKLKGGNKKWYSKYLTFSKGYLEKKKRYWLIMKKGKIGFLPFSFLENERKTII